MSQKNKSKSKKPIVLSNMQSVLMPEKAIEEQIEIKKLEIKELRDQLPPKLKIIPSDEEKRDKLVEAIDKTTARLKAMKAKLRALQKGMLTLDE